MENKPVYTYNQALSDTIDELSEVYGQREILDEIETLLLKKHHDYGSRNLSAFGVPGIVVRMFDKVARLKNLLGKQNALESRTDTWFDIIGYALQGILIERGQFELPEK